LLDSHRISVSANANHCFGENFAEATSDIGVASELLSDSRAFFIPSAQRPLQALASQQKVRKARLEISMSITGILNNLVTTSPATTTRASQLQQDFQQLGQDLNADNLSSAKQDFAALQTDAQRRASFMHQFHHRISGDTGAFSQLFQQLAQALQSGDLSAAQQAYANLQQDLQQLSQNTTQMTVSRATGEKAGTSLSFTV